MLSWPQRLGIVSGNAFEFYDIAVYAAISPYLSHLLSSHGIAHSEWMVWGIFALRFLIRPLGGLVIGKIADTQGRKKALIITSSLTGTATLLMAALPVNILGESLVILLLCLQMVQAFSFGGEYPTIIQYLHQSSRSEQQARISSLIVASSIIGVIASVLIVMGLKDTLSESQMQSYGWRIPLVIGAINIAMSFWFRLRLPAVLSAPPSPRLTNDVRATVRVGLVSITGAVVFYVQNISSSILAKDFPIQPFTLVNSVTLLMMILLVGWLTDKYILSPRTSFSWGLLAGLVISYPAYYLLIHSHYGWQQWIAFMAISLISALILANLATVLFSIARNNTTSLGLGYNIALSIFGGMSPLIVSFLSEYDASYVGAYAALTTIPALIGIYVFSAPSLSLRSETNT
ncbi:MFS transporter [Vibrio spartinae]|uniref:Alpha-ketoglutarate permease n=1 Tax=Vibrio spartinae TaxID=1918945 RepID=A0ABX6R358_9VIBR|nr:MFS transporter [Vibrio spartinae]QMV15833.1 Alpha-ketoglutarate permease [Vibrio spartinae]